MSMQEGMTYEQTWSSKEDLGGCITLYRDVIKPEWDIINRLEI